VRALVVAGAMALAAAPVAQAHAARDAGAGAGVSRCVDALGGERAPRGVEPSGAEIADGDGGASVGRIPYLGGPVISQVKVVAVFWNDQVDPKVIADIGEYYSALTRGSFMHFLSEYGTATQSIGAYGSFLGAFTIWPSNASLALLDADIPAELARQIDAGVLPASDASTVYMVHFPPGVSITGPYIGEVGVSCVDFCAYHYFGDGITYDILPDQSGGCSPGPPGCNTSSTRCCGDRTAFENLTKTASHELMETITDPQPQAPAWSDIFGGAGEIGDPCNFSRVGSDAYTSILGESGTTFQAQKGFSNAAYHVGGGSPRGCVGFPTTMCCLAPAVSTGAEAVASLPCSWLSSASQSCASAPGQAAISVPTLGGFGSGSVGVSQSSPYFGVCYPPGPDQAPDYCTPIQAAPGTVEQQPATIVLPVDPGHPYAEACYGATPDGGCPSGQTPAFGSCCGPLIAFAVSGAVQTARTTIPGVASVPALPANGAALGGALFAALGAAATRRRRSMAR
jgi:hypothetical protein